MQIEFQSFYYKKLPHDAKDLFAFHNILVFVKRIMKK